MSRSRRVFSKEFRAKVVFRGFERKKPLRY